MQNYEIFYLSLQTSTVVICWYMAAFRNLDELIRTLDREKILLKEMFEKRKALSYRQEDALSLLDYKHERLKLLIESGVILSNGDFLELEDVYLKFFEDVLQVNEQIDVASVAQIISDLKDTIEYYLKENNEQRRRGYLREARYQLRNIGLRAIRSVIDLKRNVDNTYKNEPNFQIKKTKLEKLDQKRYSIKTLIDSTENLIDKEETTFFSSAMDVQMRNIVIDVRTELIESAHNLIEIERQIINYLNLIDKQNRFIGKIRKIKYLRDQFTITDTTDIADLLSRKNPVWMEPSGGYRIKPSLDYLRTSDDTPSLLSQLNLHSKDIVRLSAPQISQEYLNVETKAIKAIDHTGIRNSFLSQSSDLHTFIMRYDFHRDVSSAERMLLYCQIAAEFPEQMLFTGDMTVHDDYRYMTIYPIRND